MERRTQQKRIRSKGERIMTREIHQFVDNRNQRIESHQRDTIRRIKTRNCLKTLLRPRLNRLTCLSFCSSRSYYQLKDDLFRKRKLMDSR